MSEQSLPHQAAEIIKQQAPGITPRIGLVLGSGLSALAEAIEDAVEIPYESLPGFPHINVSGQHGLLTIGRLNKTPVVCMQGRAHTYEGMSYEITRNYIRTLKLLGCEMYLGINASGSLREDVTPGNLMMINDHINFQPGNPLLGPNDDEFGTRFPPMDNAYDPEIRQALAGCAEKLNIPLFEGVYISVLGPSYETPAEIRAFKNWGADAVGMSTVPEVIVARHCGLKVGVIATITNLACGLSKTSLDHNDAVRVAGLATDNIIQLVRHFAEGFAN